MKTKKFISAVMATAMVASTMMSFIVFADTDETGNGILDAIPISLNEVVSEELGEKEHDWYSFSLDTSCKLNIKVDISKFTSSLEMKYEIVDADNDDTTVFTSDNFSITTLKNIIYLSAGNYYIHFYNLHPFSGCHYDMKIENTTPEDSFDALSNNSISDASAIEFDTEYKGNFYHNDAVDYYTFDLAEEGMVTINLDSSLDNVDWKIYNSDKETVEEGTFSKADNNENDSEISAVKSYVMTAGTFTIGIMKHDTSETSYGSYKLKLDYLKDYNNRAVSGVFACADINKDGFIDAGDATVVLSYYAYLSTGGTESDMNVWYKTEFAE